MSDLTGRLIGGGRYRIDSELGSSGLSVVYRGMHLTLNTPVAIKVLPRLRGQDAAAQSRFQREAFRAARLRHPNIVPVQDYGCEDDLFYVISNYIEGVDLKTLLQKQRSPLPAEQALTYIRQIGNALQYAHNQSILHRNIKPSNILIDERAKQAWLCDMGLSSTSLTQAPNLSGDATQELAALAYMSPEQAAGQALDACSDVYSFAVLVYEMLTGKHPLLAKGDTPRAFRDKLTRYTPLPAHSVNPKLNRAVDDVLARGLAKDREDRFQTMNGFLTALDAAFALEEHEEQATAAQNAPREKAAPDAEIATPYEQKPWAISASAATSEKEAPIFVPQPSAGPQAPSQVAAPSAAKQEPRPLSTLPALPVQESPAAPITATAPVELKSPIITSPHISSRQEPTTAADSHTPPAQAAAVAAAQAPSGVGKPPVASRSSQAAVQRTPALRTSHPSQEQHKPAQAVESKQAERQPPVAREQRARTAPIPPIVREPTPAVPAAPPEWTKPKAAQPRKRRGWLVVPLLVLALVLVFAFVPDLRALMEGFLGSDVTSTPTPTISAATETPVPPTSTPTLAAAASLTETLPVVVLPATATATGTDVPTATATSTPVPTQTATAVPSSTLQPTPSATLTPTPSPTRFVVRLTATPTLSQTNWIVRIDGLDDTNVRCGSLVFLKGGQEVQRLALGDQQSPWQIEIPAGLADTVRYEGGADGLCPWTRYNLEGSPSLALGSEGVVFRFMLKLTPTPQAVAPTPTQVAPVETPLKGNAPA